MSIASKLLAVLLLGGVLFTVYDWASWRRLELGKFGQGRAAQVVYPAQPLGKAFQAVEVGVRVLPPQGWTVQAIPLPSGSWANLTLDWPLKVVEFSSSPATLSVSTKKFSGDLARETNRQVAALPPLNRELQYINGNFGSATILTWEEGDQTHQVALFSKGEQLVETAAVAPSASWPTFEPTFWAVYASLTWF